MAFFKKRPKMTVAEELAQLRAEKSALELERNEARQVSELKSQVKQDKKDLRKLKSELHPSIYSKLAKGLVEVSKESYAMGKQGMKEYDQLRSQIKKEKVHSQKRKKVLKMIS